MPFLILAFDALPNNQRINDIIAKKQSMHFISDECKIHRTHIRLFQLRSIHKSYIIAINSVYFYNQTETYRFRLEFRVVEDPTVPRQPE